MPLLNTLAKLGVCGGPGFLDCKSMEASRREIIRSTVNQKQPVGALRVLVVVLVKIEVQMGHIGRYLAGGYLYFISSRKVGPCGPYVIMG